jgi:hypothetical protein
MWKWRVIVLAIGEKSVRYGNAHHMPRIFVGLADLCKAEYHNLWSEGCVIAYKASPRSFKLIEEFILYAEMVREILPGLGIGITDCYVPIRYRLRRRPFFRPKRRFEIDFETEKRALVRVQGEQTYKDDFKKLRIT